MIFIYLKTITIIIIIAIIVITIIIKILTRYLNSMCSNNVNSITELYNTTSASETVMPK